MSRFLPRLATGSLIVALIGVLPACTSDDPPPSVGSVSPSSPDVGGSSTGRRPTSPALSTSSSDSTLAGQSEFLLGVNYPWHHYGHDFGATAWGHDGVSTAEAKQKVDDDFGFLKKHGVQVVRWFVLGDCRAAPEFDAEGRATNFDEHFYNDVDAALEISQKHRIQVILVLLDFHLADLPSVVGGVQIGGRSSVVTDLEKRRAFLQNALRPMIQRYGKHREILAWEVMNEPEGAMDIDGGRWVGEPISTVTMRDFIKEVVVLIHGHASQPVTVGSASRGWLSNWSGVGLDVFQYHYYDKFEDDYPLDYPCSDLRLGKPCLVGEFPTKSTRRSVTDFLNIIHQREYAGALAWSLRGDDDYSDFRKVAGEFRDWSQAHD